MKPALAILVVVVLAYFPAIFLGKTFFFGDNYSLLVPGKLFSAKVIKSGSLPFWNPMLLGGEPFMADINQSILYPSTLLFMVLPTWIAVNATVLLHLYIGALGVYVATRRSKIHWSLSLASASIWLLTSTTVSAVNNLAAVQTLAWLPWLYVAVRRLLERSTSSSACFVAVILSLTITAGQPQPLTYFGMAMAGYVALYPGLKFQEKLHRFLFPALVAAGVTAIVTIPFIQLSSLSTRATQSAADVLQGSYNPISLLTWIVPHFFSDISRGMVWGPSWGTIENLDGYVTVTGLVALFALIKSKKTYDQRFFLWLSLVAIVVALGKYIPFSTWVYSHIQVLRLFRNPSVALDIWGLSAALLIGPAIPNLAKKLVTPRLTKYFTFSLMFIGLTCMIAWVSQAAWFSGAWFVIDRMLHHKLSLSPFHTLDRDRIIFSVVMFHAGIVALLTGTAMFLLSRKTVRWTAFTAVVILDMLFSAYPSIMLAPHTVYSLANPLAPVIAASLQPGERAISSTGYLPWTGFPTYWENVGIRPPFQDSRFTTQEAKTGTALVQRRENLSADWNEIDGIPTPFGFSTFVLKSTAAYWKLPATSSNINEVDAPLLGDARLEAQSVRYFVLDTTLSSVADIVRQDPSLKVVTARDGHAVIELPNVQPFVRSVSQDGAAITQVRVGTNTIQFHFTDHQQLPHQVVIAERMFPGWSCHATSGTCTVQEHLEGMLVTINANEATLELQFIPDHWTPLLLLSSLSFLFLVGWCFQSWRPSYRDQ
jgi:hypothetical protein